MSTTVLLVLLMRITMQITTTAATENDGLPGRPSNLNIELFRTFSNNSLTPEELRLINPKRIGMRILWDAPQDKSNLEGYNVEVRVATGYASECYENHQDSFEHVPHKAGTDFYSVTLDTSFNTHSTLKHGCAYHVAVESSPTGLSRTTYTDQTVIIPECIDNICDCSSLEPLPAPTDLEKRKVSISTKDKTRTYEISWYFSYVKTDVSPLDPKPTSVNLRLEKLEYVGIQIVYRKLKEISRPVSQKDERQTYYVRNLADNEEYRVRIYAEDNHFCPGEFADIIFPAEDADSAKFMVTAEPSLTVILAISAPLGILLTILILVIAYWGWHLRRKRRQAIILRDNSYSSSSTRTDLRALRGDILRHSNGTNLMNVLYVEKEIEEARAAGRVDEYEISPTRIKLGKQIGKGAFGRVYIGRAESIRGHEGSITVAVKQMKRGVVTDEIDDFLAEIQMMKHVGSHPNIVVLLGCCTLRQPYCMVLEFVAGGDLLRYLRKLRSIYTMQYQQFDNRSFLSGSFEKGKSTHDKKKRKISSVHYLDLLESYTTQSGSSYTKTSTVSNNSSKSSGSRSSASHSSSSYIFPYSCSQSKPVSTVIETEELQDFALQISKGMEHLELMGITHRDLAARNILIDHGKILKISDFGLSRPGIYVNTRRRIVPLRWLAVESVTDSLYSNKSDVWSYGIVLWEISTLGGFPYAQIGDAALLSYLLSGKRLQRPENASSELYDLMLSCWEEIPDKRPTFSSIRQRIEGLINHRTVYVEFDPSKCEKPKLPPTEEDVLVDSGVEEPLDNFSQLSDNLSESN